MYQLITVLLSFKIILASFSKENQYQQLTLEKHKLNKGVWMRSQSNDDHIPNNFIFSPNYYLSNEIAEQNIDNENNLDETPYFFKYLSRYRRAVEDKQRIPIEPVNEIADNFDPMSQVVENMSPIQRSVVNTKLEPITVTDVYPYEIALMVDNQKYIPKSDHYDIAFNKEQTPTINSVTNESDDEFIKTPLKNETRVVNEIINDHLTKSLKDNVESDKAFELDIRNNITTENDNSSKVNREVLADSNIWKYTNPSSVTSTKDVSTADNSLKVVGLNQKGLFKIIGTLSKIFKKIIRHHDDIKETHRKMQSETLNVESNVKIFSNTLDEFNKKYESVKQMFDKLNVLNTKISSKEKFYCNKEKEITKKLKLFEDQQSNFLIQQKQFYNIQKLLLGQNEEISERQEQIVKTQNEISHRQSNFAQILKKAKQLIEKDRKTELNAPKFKQVNRTRLNQKTKIATKYTQKPKNHSATAESVKINLFQIPRFVPLENKDEYLLKEKDLQSIDDLVYKHYFNNTFIEKYMKDNLISDFAVTPDHNGVISSTKNKRDKIKIEPVGTTSEKAKTHRRERRWIRHSRRSSRKNKFYQNKDEMKLQKVAGEDKDKSLLQKHLDVNNFENNPFLAMATKFCNEIGQNKDQQSLMWCIEKSLRKLGKMDFVGTTATSAVGSPILSDQKGTETATYDVFNANKNGKLDKDEITTKKIETVHPIAEEKSNTAIENRPTPGFSVLFKTTPSANIFFPDNDKLESNIYGLDLRKDPEGTFYYDGSVRTSAIMLDDSDGISDLLGDDANSLQETRAGNTQRRPIWSNMRLNMRSRTSPYLRKA